MKEPDIKYLFNPKNVTIIGASHHKEKIGYKILENIVNGGYKGDIYPVNPSGGEINGIKVYKSISELTDELDLVIISVPAKYVVEVVKEIGEKGAKFLAIISSGFSEVGNLKEEREIVRIAKEKGFRILGPNIFGIYSSESSLNATFGPSNITPGGVAIITQSGALGIAMIGKTKVLNMGVSAIISIGNKADITEADLLEYLAYQPITKVIFMYIEGVKNGEKLVEVLKKVTTKKPVVVIKAGKSKRGAMAAASHTGALSGSDEIFSSIMRQCGVIRAESIEEAMEWCRFLASAPMPKNREAVIITNGGGIGVIATDACEKYGIELFSDLKSLREIFGSVVPEFGSFKNPVDITGQATVSAYEKAIEKGAENQDIGAIICLGCETALLKGEELKASIKKVYNRYRDIKPMVFAFFGGEGIEEAILQLRNEGIPVYFDPYTAISCLGSLYKHYTNLNKNREEYKTITSYLERIDIEKIRELIRNALTEKRNFLLPYEAKEVMKQVGIPTPQSLIAKNLKEVIEFSEKIGYPVVMKIVSKDIIHKSDVGGVAVNLENKDEVIEAYEAIMHNVRVRCPEAKIIGVEIAEMVKGGTEIIVGARKDNIFGPVVMFGLGGIYVEIMKDVTFRSFPFDREEGFHMVKEIHSYPILLGVRGEKKKDIYSIVDVILKVGILVKYVDEIIDIEINPLMVFEHGLGCKAIDVRVIIEENPFKER